MATMGFEPIDFLSKAREIAQTFQKTTNGKNHTLKFGLTSLIERLHLMKLSDE